MLQIYKSKRIMSSPHGMGLHWICFLYFIYYPSSFLAHWQFDRGHGNSSTSHSSYMTESNLWVSKRVYIKGIKQLIFFRTHKVILLDQIFIYKQCIYPVSKSEIPHLHQEILLCLHRRQNCFFVNIRVFILAKLLHYI